MEKEYSCKLYNAIRAFLFLGLIFVLCLVLIIFLGSTLKMPIIGVLLFIFLCIAPFFWEKKIKSYFTKNVRLIFTNKNLTLILYDLKSNEELERIVYSWHNIKSYRIYFTLSKLTYLDIIFKDGKKVEYGFKENKDENTALREESIFSLLHTFINQYNAVVEDKNKINFLPGFLAGVMGTIFTMFTGVLLIIAIFLTIIQKGSAWPFLLIGFFTFVPLIAKRQNDIRFYKKIKNL